MGKIRKNLTSILVFFINLTLMGVGFLFIKNSDEAKKNNLIDKSVDVKEVIDTNVTNEKIIETPVAEKPTDISQEKIVPETKNISSSTSPTTAKPKTSSNKNSPASNTSNTSNSPSTATNNTSTSAKKSSATTKTS